MNDWIDIIKQIPPEGYDGTSDLACLVGHPIYQGQLKGEWYAYLSACREMNEIMSNAEWVASRFNLPPAAIQRIYFAVERDADLSHDLAASIDFAVDTLRAYGVDV